METSDDSVLVALPNVELNHRLARTDYANDPKYVSTEQLWRLWQGARAEHDEKRVGMFTGHLNRRILLLARPIIGRLPVSSAEKSTVRRELAQFIWTCLITRAGDAAHAQKRFGQLFKRRAIDFQNQHFAKKRTGESLDATREGEEGPEPVLEPEALRCAETPESIFSTKQEYADAVLRLRKILSSQELFVFMMLNVQEMAVKDIAKALGVTPRTVNNYKNEAQQKIEKEFHK